MSNKNKMQTCECKIQADPKTQVLRNGITPAEALVIIEKLGPQAIVDAVQKGSIERESFEEKARLKQRYDRLNKGYVDKLFPGHAANLPMTFKDAGIPVQFGADEKRVKGNITPIKDGKPDLPSDDEIKAMATSEQTVTAS